MTAPTPPVPVSLDLGFAPDDGNGDGVRLVFQALLSALNARDAYAAGLAQQIADLTTQLSGIATLTPGRKVSAGTGLTGGGDLTADRTLAIAGNGVTNDLLAQVPALTLKANLLASTANAVDASVPALLDAVFGGTQGGLLYRSATGWAPLALGPNGTVLQSNGQDVVFGPAAATTGALLATNNLSDVASPASARTNLGLAVLPLGQCRLVYSSTTALLLKPYQGNQIFVGGAYRTIPSAGVSLANTGLTAGTLYYVYAYWTGSALGLLASTTGHVTDPTTGIEVASSDSTRTLVGMAYMAAGSPGTFADSSTQRYVASWFNRQGKTLEASVSGSAAGNVVVVQFVTWADESVQVNVTGTATNNTAGSYTQTQLVIDGAAVGSNGVQTSQTTTASYFMPVGLSRVATLSENAHSASVTLSVNSGTGQWSLNHTVTVRQ